jgi:hypothetical protein
MGAATMTMVIAHASRLNVALGAVALIVALSVASPVLAGDCSAVGIFTVTLAGGTGSLVLSADGTVEMDLVLGHNICQVCTIASRTLHGTYQTVATDQGCRFGITLSTPPPIAHTDLMGGVVAAEGRVLLFLRSTSPDFESGLALRNDALTGR